MNILNIGITHANQDALDIINEAFEDILLDEVCNKTLYQSEGEAAIEEALSDWEQGNTDAILTVPAKGEERLNPAGLNGLDLIVWGDLRMAFVDEEENKDKQMELLQLAMARDLDIHHPRITPVLDAENYKTYDVVAVTNREQGLREFLELSQGNGVAYTTGRELICTSPFSKESFHESIYLAKDILKNREQYDSARTNPLPKLFVEKHEDRRRPQQQ